MKPVIDDRNSPNAIDGVVFVGGSDMPRQSGKPDWPGNPGNSGDHGGQPGGGTTKGELYGDQMVLYRDLDPNGGGGDGEPVRDPYNADGQLIAVGYDPMGLERPADADHLFPIYFQEIAEGDHEIPANLLPYVQEVELVRANVARAPAKVMEKALDAALAKVYGADVLDTDPAGRIMYSEDGGDSVSTIDAPLENLALYQHLMTTPGGTLGAWPSVTDNWNAAFLSLLGDDKSDPDWDPSSLLAAAWSKDGRITLDAMIYENTTLGVNVVTGSGENLQIDYFDLSDPAGELYHYHREATDDDFAFVDGSLSGVNDFAQAAGDARAVILFLHDFGAEEIDIGDVPPEYLDSIA